jgi:hypothetical protein
MITVRYKPVIINGMDKSGQVETVPDEQGQRLIAQGYAEIFEDITAPREKPILSQEISEPGRNNEPKRKKGWRSK